MGARGRTTFVVEGTYMYAINTATGRTVPIRGRDNTNWLLATRLRAAYRLLQYERGEDVRIEHVRSHTRVRGNANEAADKLHVAKIEEGHRVVERGSTEPPRERDEYKDNG